MATLTVKGECKICLEDKLEIEDFRVFPCGHCFCKNCIHDIFSRAERRKQPCPLCRKPCTKNDASQLIFQPVIVDSNGVTVDHVIDGLDRMDKTCKTVSVKRAHAKLIKAAEKIGEDNAARLRKAIEDFAQRIVPLFEELDLGRKRIRELEDHHLNSSRDLSSKTRRLGTLEKEVIDLRKSNQTLQKNYLEALESAEALRAKAEGLQLSLADVTKNLAAKEDEHKRAMDSLNKFRSSDALKSRKLKTLKKEVGDLSTKLQEKENVAEEQGFPMDIDEGGIGIATTSQLNVPPSGLPSLRVLSKEEGWVDVSSFEFEGLPRPGFGSCWSFPNKKANTLSKKPASSKTSPKFPLNLDAKGRPTTAVHIGPKSTIRVMQPF